MFRGETPADRARAAVPFDEVDEAWAVDLDDDAALEMVTAIVDAADQPVVLQEVAEQTSYGEVLLGDLVRRQLLLGLSVAAVFLALLAALPVINALAPDLVATPLLGLPISWLVLAALVYPLLWALGAYFVATARKYEDDFTDLVRK